MIRHVAQLVVLLGLIAGVISVDAGVSTADVSLSGPGTLDFGAVAGQPTRTGEVTITNNGTEAVALGATTYQGPFQAWGNDTCAGRTLDPGITCLVTVRPTVDAPLGRITGSLSINRTDGQSVATVGLQGLRYTSTFAAAGTGWAPFADNTLTITDDGSDQQAWGLPDLFVYEFDYLGKDAELRLTAPTDEVLTEGQWSGVTDSAFLVRPGLTMTIDDRLCWGAESDLDLEFVQIDDAGRLTGIRGSVVYRCSFYPTTIFFEYSTKEALPLEPWIGPRQLDLGTQLSVPIHAPILAVERSGEMPVPSLDGSAAPGFVIDEPFCEDRVGQHTCSFDVGLAPYVTSSELEESVLVTADATLGEVVLTATAGTAAFAWPYIGGTDLAEIVTHEDETFWVTEKQDGLIDISGGERLRIWPPQFEEFEVGTYVVNNPDLRLPGEAGIRITRSRGCVDLPGELVIHEISRRLDGSLATLRLSLNQDCGGPSRSYGGVFAYNVELGVSRVSTSPDALAFPLNDSARAVRFVTLTNDGDEAQELNAGFRGDHRRDYWLADAGCNGVLLQPQESCTQGIGFQPFGRSDDATAVTLGFVDDDGQEVVRIALYGAASFDWTPGLPPPISRAVGYWVLQSDGNVTPLGGARHLGDTRTNGIMIEVTATPTGRGYWLLDNSGNVYPHGDALPLGGLSPEQLGALRPGEVPVSMSPTPTGDGYWVFTTSGRVFRFGDAADIGSLASIDLNQPIIDAVSTPSGRGVYMIALDGGVFALGDAAFVGSVPQVLPGVRLNQPVVGLVPDPDGVGYWLVAADGGVFAFEADFNGSIPGVLPPGTRLRAAINGMVTYGNGYLLVASDGGIFNFSNLGFAGSLAGSELQSPVVAIAPIVDDSWFYG